MLESQIQVLERAACIPVPLTQSGFNPDCVLPHGLMVNHVKAAMQDFLEFLGFINTQLNGKGIRRLETMLMSANFSSMVGEYCIAAISKYCPTLIKNNYHNGHPDLIPIGMFPNDAVLYGRQGIEVKASRYPRGWQGHNVEASWLMVFTFTASRGSDEGRGIDPRPFQFDGVYGAQLEESDWTFSGRSATSRRTITASVNPSGLAKMTANWIYRR